MKCSRCGEQMSREEAADPRRDRDTDNKPICDDCFHENYEFTCCGCDEYEDIEEQARVLVVFEACGGLEPGVYNIDDLPYWTSNHFDMWFHSWNLTRLGDVPKHMVKRRDPDDYPSGHLCRVCRTNNVFPRTWGHVEVRYAIA